MRMPTVYDDDIFDIQGYHNSGGGRESSEVYSIVYLPVGFFPFAGIGNGDCFGYYWPIGREDHLPSVAFASHDAHALIPENSGLEAAARCEMATCEDHSLSSEFEAALDAAGISRPTIDFSGVVASDDHKQLLELDPDSAFQNCAVADQLIVENRLEEAEIHYGKAIDLLPEYGAAHFGMGYLLRRTRRQSQAAIYLRQSLLCPLAFWGGSFWADHILPGAFRSDWARKALEWLQRTQEPDGTLRDDPFMQNIQSFTLETGVAKSRDLELLTGMVDDYHGRGQFLDAVFVWITVGDRAALETVSFRERYGLTSRTYGNRLAQLLRDAGIARRAELVEQMIARMETPDGIYL